MQRSDSEESHRHQRDTRCSQTDRRRIGWFRQGLGVIGNAAVLAMHRLNRTQVVSASRVESARQTSQKNSNRSRDKHRDRKSNIIVVCRKCNHDFDQTNGCEHSGKKNRDPV